VLSIATTRLIPLHTGKGRTVGQAVSDIIDYAENPEKTNNGKLISSYQCDSRIADAEFLFSKRQYLARTGRRRGADDVIAYQIRQSFVPGEITPEEANRLGYELARRFTKGNHAFIVCTHVDKAHVHNHIIWNSTSLNYDRKFRDFLGSARAMRRLSDTICVQNGYSIVAAPKRRGKSYNKWQGSKTPSHRDRLRTKKIHCADPPKVNLLVDIQAKLQAGKGAGYARWAKTFNLKQMAQTLNYLTEHGLLDYADLTARADETTVHYHELSAKIKAAEKRMAEIAVLKTHIINYAKTRDTYAAYRKAGYSKKFKAEHESEILLHQAAKKFFDDAGLKKLPSVKSLQAEYAALLAEKKEAYADYRKAREEMKELLTIRANVQKLMGYEAQEQEKEADRREEER